MGAPAKKFGNIGQPTPSKVSKSSSKYGHINAVSQTREMPQIQSGETRKREFGRVVTDTFVDDIFWSMGADSKEINGVPFNQTLILAGLTNTGKSEFATEIASRAAKIDNKKALIIMTEPKGGDETAALRRNPALFDVVTPRDMIQMADYIELEAGKYIGDKYNCVIIDSISELAQDPEYMPKSASDMASPLKDRAYQVRRIKKAMRNWWLDSLEGKRGRCIFIIISHLATISRPDAVRPELVVLPIYVGGQLRSGYNLSSSISDMLQYLSSYLLVFVDVTSETFKSGTAVSGKIPTVVRVYPHKSRGSSRYDYKSFRITDDGVVR